MDHAGSLYVVVHIVGTRWRKADTIRRARQGLVVPVAPTDEMNFDTVPGLVQPQYSRLCVVESANHACEQACFLTRFDLVHVCIMDVRVRVFYAILDNLIKGEVCMSTHARTHTHAHARTKTHREKATTILDLNELLHIEYDRQRGLIQEHHVDVLHLHACV
jgi:hypothetical protein